MRLAGAAAGALLGRSQAAESVRPFLLSLLLAAAAGAQGTGRVAGLVTGAETGEPLIGAAVFVPELTLGVATGIDGRFSLDLPEGEHHVEVSYVGFERERRTVRVRAHRVLRADVALEPGDVIVCDICVPAPVALPGVYAARVLTYEGAATWCAPVRPGEPGVQHAADR